MTTPVFDFVQKYSEKETVRLHMPGHKGVCALGCENMDITEISGADSLYEADGIIRESEENASKIFGSHTLYSTEGSSLSIRAMLYLVCLYARETGRKPLILAARNVHKSFLSASVMLDFETEWIYPEENESYLSCSVTKDKLEEILNGMEAKPVCLYVTSPDYLGNTLNIKDISDVCKKHGVLLLVDNAHGAYLKFLPESLHPIDLGADLCCDSAHKTLGVLTGGAYLHINNNAPDFFKENAKNALSLFGSTSPSYLILQSLDLFNKEVSDGYRDKLESFIDKVNELKVSLKNNGYSLLENEPLKITVDIKKYGYIGKDFAKLLSEKNIECEFADDDFVVFMFTPCLSDEELKLTEKNLLGIEKLTEINAKPPKLSILKRALSPREAAFSKRETLPAENCLGRILAVSSVGCPPAVPIVTGGEIIDERCIENFRYYKTESCIVVKE